MKRLLMFSVSVAILCGCGAVVFLLLEHNRTRLQLKEKRTKLDAYYASEFLSGYISLSSSKSCEEILGLEKIEKAEADMLNDGYDRAEIEEIRNKAYCNERDYLMVEKRPNRFLQALESHSSNS